MPDQISLRELLQDPQFKEWMRRPPTLKPNCTTTPPWILYCKVEVGGLARWTKAEFETYPKAFNHLVKMMRAGQVIDAAIHAKRQEFKPPVLKIEGKRHYWPSPPGHRWCGYCRRPTVFKYFKRHHNMKLCASYEQRCSICGIRWSSLRRFDTPLKSRFA